MPLAEGISSPEARLLAHCTKRFASSFWRMLGRSNHVMIPSGLLPPPLSPPPSPPPSPPSPPSLVESFSSFSALRIACSRFSFWAISSTLSLPPFMASEMRPSAIAAAVSLLKPAFCRRACSQLLRSSRLATFSCFSKYTIFFSSSERCLGSRTSTSTQSSPTRSYSLPSWIMMLLLAYSSDACHDVRSSPTSCGTSSSSRSALAALRVASASSPLDDTPFSSEVDTLNAS
mmetsp:Transcript_21001/g.52221  ORF Transcript_21001/g.52221 Transcript_21001/m.52221 type:complete len:231 (-) Transcript_21001:97-789(-)